jgi:hypothetical protein
MIEGEHIPCRQTTPAGLATSLPDLSGLSVPGVQMFWWQRHLFCRRHGWPFVDNIEPCGQGWTVITPRRFADPFLQIIQYHGQGNSAEIDTFKVACPRRRLQVIQSARHLGFLMGGPTGSAILIRPYLDFYQSIDRCVHHALRQGL